MTRGYYKIIWRGRGFRQPPTATKAWQHSYMYVKCKKDGTEFGDNTSNGYSVDAMHEMLDAGHLVIFKKAPEAEE